MIAIQKTNTPVTKRTMLERLQFSNNLQTAVRCAKLLNGSMTEDEINGSFLTAVCKDNYHEALMRADDHNRAALMAKDFSVGRFEFIGHDKNGYIRGGTYWLKVSTKSGVIEITPTAITDAEQVVYHNLFHFSNDFNPIRNRDI